MISVGGTIINRTLQIDIGKLMLKHEGGGHKKVGVWPGPACKNRLDTQGYSTDDQREKIDVGDNNRNYF